MKQKSHTKEGNSVSRQCRVASAINLRSFDITSNEAPANRRFLIFHLKQLNSFWKYYFEICWNTWSLAKTSASFLEGGGGGKGVGTCDT